MLSRYIRWKVFNVMLRRQARCRLRLRSAVVGVLCALPLLVQAEKTSDLGEDIPYRVTAAKGGVVYAIDPAEAYKGLARGTIDVEPMDEVPAFALPSTLPEPTIVPSGPRQEYILLRRIEKDGPPRKGEDRVFHTIARDEKRERCLIYGEACSALEIIEEEE